MVQGVEVTVAVQNDVLAAAFAAGEALRRWGDLRAPVLIVVHPTHDALEAAVGHRGLPWLRAWAQYDRIDLQSPTTFGHRDYRAPLRELLAHELTHVLMYQRVGTPARWHQVYVPFWFREGMASWTAEQGYRRGTPASLGRRLAAHPPEIDPLLDGQALTRSDQPLAYGAAHWGFDQLVVEADEHVVIELLDDLRRAHVPCLEQGAASTCGDGRAAFGAAFTHRVGEDEASFAARFRARLISEAARSPGT